ncbi:ABC transporter permease [Actinobacteria bacterium YIM 96077]|uniref:ABC transporter permease n=1 Tax=Phytoactinopolyspora halophila TaxID=1981511 RepID=A0A329QWC2_9ACTN|nr:ABC transporter permease [Phytoactinopolyspora halophila]AYY12794.1 ABC transporter permease [Actinobacteria bacterium YIM 96077]RAW16413.1 ABC transporter permease [Phytoactinopolyspora halophila]
MTETTASQDRSASQEATAGGQTGAASLWGDAWRELRRNPFFVVSALLILVLIVMAIAPQLFTSIDPRSCDLSRSLERPSADHWFGFDLQGCDYYSRVIYGARASIVIGVAVTSLTAFVAIVLGLIAGYYGGWQDSVISRFADLVFALPFLLGAIVFLSVIDSRGIPHVALALIVFSWPIMTRIMRSSVIAAKSADYVAAAKVLGASDFRIMRKHILPNALAPLVVYATVFIGLIIAAEASLTFLGVGLQLPAISWGLQLSGARTQILTDPHLIFFPGVFVALTVFAFVLMGDALRDALDPKLR